MADRHVLARLLPEFTRGHSDRSCHVFPVSTDEGWPEVLHAYCGLAIASEQAERLESPVGMPCVVCLLRMAVPD
jgi:hypothetical protein